MKVRTPINSHHFKIQDTQPQRQKDSMPFESQFDILSDEKNQDSHI